MAVRTLYLSTAAVTAGPGTYLAMDEGSAPTAAKATTGCIPGNASVPRFYAHTAGSKTPQASANATSRISGAPNGADGFRSVQTYNGTFAAGDWAFSCNVIADTSGGQLDGNVNFKLYRVTAGGTYTQLTSGAALTSGWVDVTTATAQTLTASVTLGAVTLTDEYLVIQCEWKTTGGGTSTARDLVWYSGTGHSLATTDFTGTASGDGGTVLTPTGLALTAGVGTAVMGAAISRTVTPDGLALTAGVAGGYEVSASATLTPDALALGATVGSGFAALIVNPAAPSPTPIISGRQLALSPLRKTATLAQSIDYVNDAFGKVQLAVGDPPMMPLRSTSEVVSVVGATTIDTVKELLRADSRVEMVRVLPTIAITGATTMAVGDATTPTRFRAASAVPSAGIVCLAHHDNGLSVVEADAGLRLTFDIAPSAGAVKIEVFYRQYVVPTLG